MPESFSLDVLAAKFLAAAVSRLCPKAQIIEARGESYGFACEFYSSESVSDEMLPFLEEGFHQLLAEKENIQIFEMVASNALEFLRFHHQTQRAHTLKDLLSTHFNKTTLVKTIKIANYVDFFEQEFSHLALQELKNIKLLSLTHHLEKGFHGEQKNLFRIKGVSAPHSQELKKIIKNIKEATRHYHTEATHLFTLKELGEEEERQKALFWLPAGIQVKQQLLDLFKKTLVEHTFHELESKAQPSSQLLSCLALKQTLASCFWIYQDRADAEEEELFQERGLGLYGLEDPSSLVAIDYFKEKNISLTRMLEIILQLLENLKLPFSIQIPQKWRGVKDLLSGMTKASIVENPQGSKMTFFVKDSFERVWKVAFLEIEEKKNPCYVTLRLFSLERWVALLLDLCKGSWTEESLAKIFRK